MTVLDDHIPAGAGADEPTAPPDGQVQGHGWFGTLARFAGRRRKTVVLIWLAVVLLAAPLAITLSGALSGAGWEAQGSTAQEVRDELRQDFPQLGAESAVVVYHQDTPSPAELGVTLAVAVALDATVVRMMLVPSLMGLLGERNWWIPKLLDARLPRVHFSH